MSLRWFVLEPTTAVLLKRYPRQVTSSRPMMSSPRRVQKSNAVADRLRGPKVPPTPPAPPRKRINNALNVVTLYKVDFTPVIFFLNQLQTIKWE